MLLLGNSRRDPGSRSLPRLPFQEVMLFPGCGKNSDGLACDHDFLVRINDEYRHAGIRAGDHPVPAHRLAVSLFIKVQPQELHVAANLLADAPRVFPNAARKGDSVKPTHGGGIGADELFNLVSQDLDSKRGAPVAGLGSSLDVAQVTTDSGDSQ